MVTGATFEVIQSGRSAVHCEMPLTVKCTTNLQYVALCVWLWRKKKHYTNHGLVVGFWICGFDRNKHSKQAVDYNLFQNVGISQCKDASRIVICCCIFVFFSSGRLES